VNGGLGHVGAMQERVTEERPGFPGA
jgi:hypothetical protein